MAEYAEQARTVAGGGATAGRIATGGVVAARAVSGRAAESLTGVHRCIRFSDHIGVRHGCGCGYEWHDHADDDSEIPEP